MDIWEALRAESATPRGGPPAVDLDEQMLQRYCSTGRMPPGLPNRLAVPHSGRRRKSIF